MNYVHLGEDVTVSAAGIVAVLDLDRVTVTRGMRDFLARAEAEGRTVTVGSGLPKSIVLHEARGVRTVYITQAAPQALAGRMR